ncbi:MAG: flagellin, partial [Chitinispirillales bacterium]|nr:flagellin [Chitinispirillales bacterium]
AQTAITNIDEVIRSVSEMRADIGAYVNRLESTVNNLTVSAANQTNAESQLRDVDFAFQSSQFTKNQILTQSATAMLSQANAVPQNVLSLLR